MSIKISSKLKAQSAKRKAKIQNFPAFAGSRLRLSNWREKFLILRRNPQRLIACGMNAILLFLLKGKPWTKVRGASLLNFSFALYVLSFTLICYAAPCYGTKMPPKKEIYLGLQSYSIFKRYLEHEAGKLRSLQELFLLSYGVYDWLSIDLKGGAGYIKQHPTGSDELDYPTYMGGGYGFRLKLFKGQDTQWVFGFQHISIHPKTIDVGPRKHKAVLDDWQFSTLISYDLKKVTPYCGARWSRADYIHWIDRQRDRVKSDLKKSFGLIVGFDFPITKRVWLNLEGQFLDSEALAFSINYNL